VSNGWGTADTGGAYTLTGTAADFSVNGTMGLINVSTPGATRIGTLASVSARDVDTRFRVQSDKLATGSGEFVSASLRRTSSGQYLAKLYMLSSGAVYVQASRVDSSGNEVVLGNGVRVPGVTHTVNQSIWLRAQAVGVNPTTLRLKAWADGQSEPAAWLYQTTDLTAALQGPGSVGLRTYISGQSTNAPIRFAFDDWRVTYLDPNSPQAQPALIASPPVATNLRQKAAVQQFSVGSAVIQWRTASGTTAQVRYGLHPTYPLTVVGKVQPVDRSGTHLNQAIVAGLQPNTTYYYKVFTDGLDMQPNELLSFQTTASTLFLPLVGKGSSAGQP